MKYALIATTSETVINFRKSLINFLIEKDNEVVVIAHDNIRQKEIEDLGVKFYCINQNNRSTNPFSILKYPSLIKKILLVEKPDRVFTFMLKPNTFGVIGAKKAGVQHIFSMVEGAGDVFINNSLKWRIIRRGVCMLYRKSFKKVEKVFFLNEDDRNEFIERKLVKSEKCQLINGIGVDTNHFAFKPIKNNKTFLMVARMLKTKGVMEYCESAKIVKTKYPDAVFNYLGGEGTVTLDDIKDYVDKGIINYLGTAKDVRQYIEECSVFVLPSYREGFPVSVMEAEASGRAVITTKASGCKNTVKDGYNGYLVNVKSAEELAEKMIYFIEHPDKQQIMGENARKFAEENFDNKLINEKIYSVIS